MTQVEEKVISPTYASMLLAKNTENFRPVNWSRVSRYAADMTSGSWLYCADPIRIAIDGTLLDGQHRLHAIVKAGKPLKCLVVTGLEKNTAMMMDKGQPRSAKSWLAHEGVKNTTHITAMARMCLMYRKGKWHYVTPGSEAPTDSDTIEFVRQHNDSLQSAFRVARIADAKTYIPASMLAVVMHEAAFPRLVENVEDCVWFCARLNDGQNIVGDGLVYSNDSPVYHLRERFFHGQGKKNAAKRENAYIIRALTTIAWNGVATRKTVKVLRFSTEGKNATEFPRIIEKAT